MLKEWNELTGLLATRLQLVKRNEMKKRLQVLHTFSDSIFIRMKKAGSNTQIKLEYFFSLRKGATIALLKGSR